MKILRLGHLPTLMGKRTRVRPSFAWILLVLSSGQALIVSLFSQYLRSPGKAKAKLFSYLRKSSDNHDG